MKYFSEVPFIKNAVHFYARKRECNMQIKWHFVGFVKYGKMKQFPKFW